MRVVIAEAQYMGHYYTYARRVLEAAREVTSDITLMVSPAGLKSKEFATNLESSLGNIEVIDCLPNPQSGMLRSSWDRVRGVRDAVKRSRADHLLVPTADYTAQAVGIASMLGYRAFPRRVEAEGLLTVLSFTYEGGNRTVPTGLVTRGLQHSPWTRLHLIDLLAVQWLKNRLPRLAERFSVIPDPVEDFRVLSQQEARRELGIPEDGRLLVCPGVLIFRKGIGLLLDAFLKAKTSPTDRILLAGPLGKDVAETLRESRFQALIQSERVLVIDKYLDVDGLGQAISAGNVTACPYPNQWHPSSIAIKSLACRRPVLGADNFWLGKMVPAFQMGWTANVRDPASLAHGIEQAMAEAEHWSRSQYADRLVEFQSIERFRSCWVRRLRERMGLPETAPQFDFNKLIQDVGLENYGRL